MIMIKVMADYQCHPLWEATPGKVGNLDPRALPISQELQQRLCDWAHAYDRTLNWNDPLSSGFQTVQDEEEFEKNGIGLTHQLQGELGTGYTIFYKSCK